MTGPNHSDLQRDMGGLQRDIGGLEAGLEALKDAVEKGFSDTGNRIDKVETRLASLEAMESQRKGAFSLGHWLIGILSGVAVFVTDHFLK